MTAGSGKSNGYTSPALGPPSSCVHGPETAETSLAAWSLLPAVIWPNAFWTPPRHVCRVPMLVPWRKARTAVVESVELVVANWPSVESIDARRASRSAVVTALA